MIQTDYTGMKDGVKKEWSPLVYTDDNNLTGMAQIMVFLCHIYSVWEITIKNWEECYTRLDMWQRGMGGLLQDGEGNDHMITPGDVHSWIGFKINAGTENKQAYHGKLNRAMRDKSQGRINEWKKGGAK